MISPEEKLTNLRYLLSNEEDMHSKRCKVGQLPSNDDVLRLLLTQDDASPATLPNREYEVFVNSVVAVIWIVNAKKTWYLGYITEIKENDEYIVDHLERVQSTKNELWRFPNKEDECPALL